VKSFLQIFASKKNAVLRKKHGILFDAINESSSGLFDDPDEIQQNDGSDHGRHQRADEAISRQPDHAKQPTTEQRADDADDEIADQAHAALFHELSGEPTGGETDEQKPKQTIHLLSSFWVVKNELQQL
jgi:hypothetical protein